MIGAPNEQNPDSHPKPATKRDEGSLLIPLLVVVAGVFAFALLAYAVREGRTQTFDEKIVIHMRHADDPSTPVGPGWLPKAARDITGLGGHAVLFLVVFGVAGCLLLERRRGAMWLVLLSSGGGWALTMVLKEIFGRQRPAVVPPLVYESSPSFPSGHAMMSAVVYLTLGALLTRLVEGRAVRMYVLGVAVLVTLLVGSSRVFMGVHYPTDVLAGWLAGAVWAALCWMVERRLQQQGSLERPADR